MDFVILANAWSAAADNPTSKHQIALELARQGHRVLWIEGAGMRRPSAASARDRARAWQKIVAAWRGPERHGAWRMAHGEEVIRLRLLAGARSFLLRSKSYGGQDGGQVAHGEATGEERSASDAMRHLSSVALAKEDAPLVARFAPCAMPPSPPAVWVLSPLTIPLPAQAWARRFNGWLVASLARSWARRLGFQDPVLINYVPVFAEVMKRWQNGKEVRAKREGEGSEQKVAKDPAGSGASAKEDGAVHHSSLTAHRSPVVYHCVDRWDSFGLYDRDLMASLDADCCRQADVVVASSADLYERCKPHNANTHLVTHGVDYEHFAKALEISRPCPEATASQGGQVSDFRCLPRVSRGQASGDEGNERSTSPRNCGASGRLLRDAATPNAQRPTPKINCRRPDSSDNLQSSIFNLQSPAGPIIGFFGLISEWVDQDLLVRLAREIPTVHIALIGKADVPTDRLAAEPNIHLLGPRAYADLPSYAAQFDVGIIPFVVNDLTRAVNPIKLREMLAAGCPVVTTALPEAERSQRSEVRGQRSEVRGQGSDPRGRRTPRNAGQAEDPARRGASRGRRAGVRSQRTRKRAKLLLRHALCALRSALCPPRHLSADMSAGALAKAEASSASEQAKADAPLVARFAPCAMPSSDAVAVARDADEFIGLVRERLERPATLDERRAISESVREETWKAKVEQLLALISLSWHQGNASMPSGI